jgi:hypothetical protein
VSSTGFWTVVVPPLPETLRGTGLPSGQLKSQSSTRTWVDSCDFTAHVVGLGARGHGCLSGSVAAGRHMAGSFLSGRSSVLSFRPHHGAVAQLVAHLVRNEGVRGSSPLSSTDITAGQRPSTDSGRGPLWSFGAEYSSKVQQLLI